MARILKMKSYCGGSTCSKKNAASRQSYLSVGRRPYESNPVIDFSRASMTKLISRTIEQIRRETDIEPEILVSAIEDAMVVAARKFYKTEEDLRAKFNPETGQVDLYSVYTIVEEVTDPKKEVSLAQAKKKNPAAKVGTEILAAKPTDVLGRIAAQTAKQVILQKVREAERDTIFNEYHTRVGELVTVIVKRAEGPDLIVDMGRTEARLPKREQSKLETYNI